MYQKKKRGFTLIELLVVVLLIGILAAVAVPQYQKAVEKSRASEALVLLNALREQQALCYMELGYDAAGCAQGNEDDGDLFTNASIELTGELGVECEGAVCGPATRDFVYYLDGETIGADRRPYNTKYHLLTSALPTSNVYNQVICSNDDEDTDWCKIIGVDSL